FSPQTLGELKRIQQAALNSDYAYRQQDARNYFHCHHTAADTLDKIVPKELVENSAVVAVTAYVLANMEQPLFR
ncbi:MAG: hypothetical protein ABJB69_08830, partial [Spartobacteria bacterium]